MFSALHIRRFKCFLDFKLEGIAPVTLVGGANSIGKTSLLEAVFMVFDRCNPDAFIRLTAWRGVPEISLTGEGLFAPFFFDYDLTRSPTISLNWGGRTEHLSLAFLPHGRTDAMRGGGDRTGNGKGYVSTDLRAMPPFSLAVTWRVQGGPRQVSHLVVGSSGALQFAEGCPQPDVRPGYFLQTRKGIDSVEDAGRYGELDALGKADRVLNFMKDFFPALRSLSVIPTPGGKSLIHADVGLARKTVAGCVGDGFSRLLSIYLAMARAQNGVVLIDEIGGGVHYKALVRLWKGILQAAREFRCQVIATTHSYETIEAAREAMSEGLFAEDFAYVRLEKGDKGVVAKTYPFPVLDAALERNWEVR